MFKPTRKCWRLTGRSGLVTSIMRTVAFFQNDPLKDGTWASVIFLYWTIIEPGCYLIAACLPCYRPLLNLFISGTGDIQQPGSHARSQSGSRSRFPKLFSSKSTSYNHSKPTYTPTTPEGLPLSVLDRKRRIVHRKSDEEILVGTHITTSID